MRGSSDAAGEAGPPWVGLLHLSVLYTVWSTTYLAIRVAVRPGGFPPFLLQPINFDQVYAEQLKRRQQSQAA